MARLPQNSSPGSTADIIAMAVLVNKCVEEGITQSLVVVMERWWCYCWVCVGAVGGGRFCHFLKKGGGMQERVNYYVCKT